MHLGLGEGRLSRVTRTVDTGEPAAIRDDSSSSPADWASIDTPPGLAGSGTAGGVAGRSGTAAGGTLASGHAGLAGCPGTGAGGATAARRWRGAQVVFRTVQAHPHQPGQLPEALALVRGSIAGRVDSAPPWPKAPWWASPWRNTPRAAKPGSNLPNWLSPSWKKSNDNQSESPPQGFGRATGGRSLHAGPRIHGRAGIRPRFGFCPGLAVKRASRRGT